MRLLTALRAEDARVLRDGVGNGPASCVGGNTGVRWSHLNRPGVWKRGQIGVVGRNVRSMKLSLEGRRPREAPGPSNTRSPRGPLAARATEVGPAETASPVQSDPSISASVGCDGLAETVLLAARPEAEISRFQLTDGVDTGT